jgi:hypothetical protein
MDVAFLVRSPGFEPGSSTWQADVLNQTRLRPLHLDYGHFNMGNCLFSLSEHLTSVNVCDVFQILVLLVSYARAYSFLY